MQDASRTLGRPVCMHAQHFTKLSIKKDSLAETREGYDNITTVDNQQTTSSQLLPSHCLHSQHCCTLLPLTA